MLKACPEAPCPHSTLRPSFRSCAAFSAVFPLNSFELLAPLPLVELAELAVRYPGSGGSGGRMWQGWNQRMASAHLNGFNGLGRSFDVARGLLQGHRGTIGTIGTIGTMVRNSQWPNLAEWKKIALHFEVGYPQGIPVIKTVDITLTEFSALQTTVKQIR
jgi:hypothetical protein